MWSPNPGTILIVDDHKDNVHQLGRVLEMEGFTIIPAYTGMDALEIIPAKNPDLVLLDIMMPIVTGLEVLVMVRQRYTMEELPVILISALSETEDIVKGLNQQANDYLTKPYNIDIVLSRIRTHITLKQMADERRKMVNALQHANAMNNRLMRIASHDMKNPISNLNMIHALLKKEVEKTEETEELFEMAKRTTQIMDDIINEFLNYEILSGEEMKVRLNPVDVKPTVLEVVNDFRYMAESKSIQLHTALDEVEVIADKKRLKQVLANLISNAVKYTPKGSSVHIQTQVIEDNVLVHIIDEGKGIPQDEMDKLFQPFGSLSTRPTDGENSTGLGLWIVKQMIEAQNGEVGLNTEYIDGANFWIRLPITQTVLEIDKT